MRFKIDENLPIEVAQLLRDAGHDARTVVEQELGGAADSDLAATVASEDRVLVTLDIDFSDIRTYPLANSPGILILRLRRQDTASILSVVRRLIDRIPEGELREQLWIVEESRIRVRASDGAV